MNRIFIFLLLFSFSYFLNAENIIISGKIARINNEIILQSDVERYAELYKISFEQAKTDIIEESILYYGARITVDEPSAEEIDKQIKSDKAFYATKLGKSTSEFSDEEFISMIQSNVFTFTIRTYREYVKRSLWIEKYLKEEIEKNKKEEYIPDQSEIKEFISKNPGLFEEKEGVILSMIYFSYYGPDEKKKSNEDIKALSDKSKKCLEELNKGTDFYDAVASYSDDLISLNASPKGRIGNLYFDDPRINGKLTDEMISAFKNEKTGIIKQVFSSKDGLFIFKIEEKLKAKKYSEKESILKAEAFIRKDHENQMLKSLRSNLFNDLKSKIDMKIYK